MSCWAKLKKKVYKWELQHLLRLHLFTVKPIIIKIVQSTLKIFFLTFESNDSFAHYVILSETSNLLGIQHLNNT